MGSLRTEIIIKCHGQFAYILCCLSYDTHTCGFGWLVVLRRRCARLPIIITRFRIQPASYDGYLLICLFGCCSANPHRANVEWLAMHAILCVSLCLSVSWPQTCYSLLGVKRQRCLYLYLTVSVASSSRHRRKVQQWIKQLQQLGDTLKKGFDSN